VIIILELPKDEHHEIGFWERWDNWYPFACQLYANGGIYVIGQPIEIPHIHYAGAVTWTDYIRYIGYIHDHSNSQHMSYLKLLSASLNLGCIRFYVKYIK